MQALAFLPFSATVLAHAPPMRCFPPDKSSKDHFGRAEPSGRLCRVVGFAPGDNHCRPGKRRRK